MNNKDKNNSNRYTSPIQSFPPQVPSSDFAPEDVSVLSDKLDKQLKDFSALLDSLSSIEEKRKSLWKQIYENAVTDRRNAYILFGDLYKNVHNNSAQHALHGQTLAKYLERMEKSNNQLIKLAEIIDEMTSEEENWITDENSMYDKIKQTQKI